MILHFLLANAIAGAFASSYYIQPFSQFTHEATAIVRGTLSNIHTENDISSDGSKIIYTYATMDISEVLKGPITGSTTVIRELGGTKDGYSLVIAGSPPLRNGEDTVIFLGPENSDQSHDITSLELGKFGVQDKDGQATLTGGFFNFTKHNDHTAGDSFPENDHPWTLAELRATIEKQAGKTAPPVSSTPHSTPKNEVKSDDSGASMSAVDPHASIHRPEDSRSKTKEGIPDTVTYGVFGLAVACLALFFFRKR